MLHSLCGTPEKHCLLLLLVSCCWCCQLSLAEKSCVWKAASGYVNAKAALGVCVCVCVWVCAGVRVCVQVCVGICSNKAIEISWHRNIAVLSKVNHLSVAINPSANAISRCAKPHCATAPLCVVSSPALVPIAEGWQVSGSARVPRVLRLVCLSARDVQNMMITLTYSSREAKTRRAKKRNEFEPKKPKHKQTENYLKVTAQALKWVKTTSKVQ